MTMNMGKALKTGAVGVFAAFHVVLYLLPSPLWRNWAVFLEPIEGIILGPYAGSLTAFIGCGLGRIIKPDPQWMFGVVAEPSGVLAVGFLAKGNWKPVALIYSVMLGAYFIHPFGQMFPLWTIADIIIAFFLVYPVAKIGKSVYGKNSFNLTVAAVLIFFVGAVTDSLVRVFLLVPVRLYDFFGWPYDFLYNFVFVPGAVISFAEDGLAIIVAVLVGVPIIIALRRFPAFKYPIT